VRRRSGERPGRGESQAEAAGVVEVSCVAVEGVGTTLGAAGSEGAGSPTSPSVGDTGAVGLPTVVD
jgi:hypothetical protein